MRSLLDYIAERNPRAANDMLARVEGCAERLLDHPFLHRPGRVPGTREAVVHPNYILIYRVGEDTLEVVNIIHSRRRYPPTEPDDL